MKRIILTGGGTAGHVTPNIALIPRLKKLGYDIHYIGSYNGIEKELIEPLDVTYHCISSGKLRRYFSLQNFTDPFRVLKGFGEANKIIKKVQPNVLFSKGGFVSVPAVVAAKRQRIPAILHESDLTPGLANKLTLPFAQKVCCNFPETYDHLPPKKALLSGLPIRSDLLTGDKEKAKALCGFSEHKPVLLVVGGSLGAASINQALRSALTPLLQHFQIIHVCGKGKLEERLQNTPGYVQFEYLHEKLKDMFALADVILSRAGANAIYEFLALQKASLLIPLSANASRGDQILNARSFEKQGYSKVLLEEDLNDETLIKALLDLYENRENYVQAIKKSRQQNATEIIVTLIEEYANKKTT